MSHRAYWYTCNAWGGLYSGPTRYGPDISLIILKSMKILQWNLNRNTFVVWEMWRHYNLRWKWPSFASSKDWTRCSIFWKFLASTLANNIHSLLHSISTYFPTILCELTIYTNTHEQQPYCVGTLSQMTERSAERRVKQETGWLAGGPLLRVPTIRRTTDTHYKHIPFHFSHNKRTPVQISLQYRHWCQNY
jgi:hypothetical protein